MVKFSYHRYHVNVEAFWSADRKVRGQNKPGRFPFRIGEDSTTYTMVVQTGFAAFRSLDHLVASFTFPGQSYFSMKDLVYILCYVNAGVLGEYW
jgi:hypothetical protein